MNALAVNYCEDANNVGCFLMEDSGTETDRGGNTSNDVTESAGDTIDLNTSDFKFGSGSRDWEASHVEWLEHADGLDTDITGTSISMVGWIKVESFGDDHVLMGKWEQSDDHQYMLRVTTSGVPECHLASTSSGITSALGNAGSITVGTWHHMACVYDGSNITLYVDGSVDTNGTDNPKSFTSSIVNGSTPFRMGIRTSFSNPADPVDGLMDDLAIFTDALSSGEIADIIANGLIGSGGGGGGGSPTSMIIVIDED